jgi:hypothetical protein
MQLLALNKTCRYCPRCDLLIAHQDELEAWLAAFFTERQPEIVGNDFLVIGTEIAQIGCVEFARPYFRKRLWSTCTISARSSGSPRHRGGCLTEVRWSSTHLLQPPDQTAFTRVFWNP